MFKRYLSKAIQSIAFSDHKMAFISGPRQCGKTTLSRLISKEYRNHLYYNWDDIEFRRIWAKNPKNIIQQKSKKNIPLIVLDEIHKARAWKRSIKGVYDTLLSPADILVTGSARLNIFKKGGDSLLGRYYHFHLHPFSLAELLRKNPPTPDLFLKKVFERKNISSKKRRTCLKNLLEFGNFPEPYLSQEPRKARLWRKNRMERIIREDLRDLSRIPELSQVEMLATLLPERAGSPLSLNGLREDLEVSYDTVKRWIYMLSELYYIFCIPPYSKSIKRSLKKEKKLYLWDYSEIEEKGARLENLVACHLLKACHYWTDTGEGIFELFYLRNKEKQEIDFLITKNKAPWLPIEVKSSNTEISPNWKKFLPMLPCSRGIQLTTLEENEAEYEVMGGSVSLLPVSSVLAELV